MYGGAYDSSKAYALLGKTSVNPIFKPRRNFRVKNSQNGKGAK